MKCFVPGCPNRSRDLNKLFFSIPRDPAIKNVWYEKVGYSNECARKASPLCCEDHFDLPEDMENYMRYRFMGGQKKLKKGILPRFNLPKVTKIDQKKRRGIAKMKLDLPESSVLNRMNENIIKTKSDLTENEAVLSEANILSQMSTIIKTESDLPEMELDIPETNLMSQMNECIIIKTESDIPGVELNLSAGDILTQMDESIIKTESDISELNTLNKIDKCINIKVEPNLSEMKLDSSDTREEERFTYNPDQQTNTICRANKCNGVKYIYNTIQQSKKINLTNKHNGLKYPYNLDMETDEINFNQLSINQDLLHGINHDHKHMFTSCSDEIGVINKGVQTKPHFRSKATMYTYKPKTKHAATSPVSFQEKKRSSDPEAKKPKVLISDEEWMSEASDPEIEEVRIEILKDRMFETRTKAFIENDPLLFLGVPKNSMHIIADMQKDLNIPIEHIYCVLKKIRLNLSNEVLSYDFGLSYSQISQIFKKTVPLIANFLKGQIFWPEENVISENLPVQFRNRLRKVQSILNIFEIKMERSSLIQELRLPSYESTDTARFLVSSTPKGFINFVSTRFSKRNSDVTIVETSGFLDVLPDEVVVLTLVDCGFKYVDTILRRKNCRLIRLPSISLKRNWKAESKFSRWLASVRIHVKRLMNQLTDFKLLENSINLGKRSESLLDDIVIISAALVNLQLSARNEEDSV